MSEERTLANIAQAAYWTVSESQDTFDRVAKAVEAEVLKRLKKSEFEPVAGQELTFVQAAQWVEKHGSTSGLQWFYTDKQEWRKDGYCKGISSCFKYRVAPKVNDPDDPTTWEKGVVVFLRNYEHEPWVLDRFMDNIKEFGWKFSGLNTGIWKHAKLATPEQVEAWKLINENC